MGFVKINTDDQNTNLIQDNIDRALVPLQNAPLTGGVLLKNKSLISGQDNLIAHTLNQVPTFYLIGLPTTQSTIWSPASSSLGNQPANATYLNLRCSANCTVTVWVA